MLKFIIDTFHVAWPRRQTTTPLNLLLGLLLGKLIALLVLVCRKSPRVSTDHSKVGLLSPTGADGVRLNFDLLCRIEEGRCSLPCSNRILISMIHRCRAVKQRVSTITDGFVWRGAVAARIIDNVSGAESMLMARLRVLDRCLMVRFSARGLSSYE